jgi:type I restriction enzyme S subunit
MMIQKALHRIRPHSCLDSSFLFYSFLKKRKNDEFSGLFTGSTIKHLPKEKLAKVKVDVPPIAIQRRVVDILSAYDDLIENNRRRIALLEKAARMLYREWFVHFRFPGHEHVKIVDGLPEGWGRRALGEIAEVRLGKMLDEKKNRGDLRPYLANVNVRWGRFDLSELRTMRFEIQEIEKYGLVQGDIVMCEGGEPGRCAIWKDQVPGMMLQKALHRIRSHAALDRQFLYYCLSFMAKSGRLVGLFTGSTIKHLPREKLVTVPVKIPPERLVREFADNVAPIEAQIRTLEAAIWRASEARDLLLPRLMNGEIAV